MDNLKPQQIVLLASGAVLFLFSFLAFYSGGGESRNAWSGDIGLSPLSIFPSLLGLAVAGLVAAVAFGNVSLPDRVLTFTWPQVFFTAGFASFFIHFGFLIVGAPGGASLGIGFYFMLLASIGILVGAVMEITQGDSTNGSAAGGPAQPF